MGAAGASKAEAGKAGSPGNYSLRRAAEDKPRAARHLPEEEAKIR